MNEWHSFSLVDDAQKAPTPLPFQKGILCCRHLALFLLPLPNLDTKQPDQSTWPSSLVDQLGWLKKEKGEKLMTSGVFRLFLLLL
jgi:hypothetical protein